MQCKTIVSDILVVGGGGAGVMSSVMAAREGATVAIAVKGKIGKSGNLMMLGGSFGVDGPSAREYCNEPEASQEYTKEALFDKLVSSAFYIGDQKLQKHFVEEGPKALKEFFQWVRDSGQKFLFNPKACRWRTSGTAFGNVLKKGLRNQQKETVIDTYEDTMITELLTCDGKVCGALGMNMYTGELIEFKAKAVILATGGYQPMPLKNTFSDMTGDGIAMALRAGAEVKDMEYLLFIPTLIEPAYAKGSILPFQMTMPNLFPLKQKATDLDGVELIYPQDSKYKTTASSSKVKKLLIHYFYGEGIYKKWDKYGNRFYFDYSDYTDDEIREAFRIIADNMEHWYKKGMYHHIDLMDLAERIIKNDKRLLVGLGNEYSMGGVVVDETFATRVPGLYAAGEVTSGVFGAFRSADGLTEMLAHGLTAGKTAGEYVKSAAQLEPEDLDEKVAVLTAPLNRSKGISPIEALNKLESICDKGFNFFRDEERLVKAYEEICSLRASLDQMAAPGGAVYNLEWMNSVIVRNLALCAEIGIYSAMQRKETRGCHVRSDYPQVNNKEYMFSYTASLKDGDINYGKSYPEAVYMPIDNNIYPNIAECISKTILEVI
ncbi:FAD-binding protein [Lutispora sp.]|uniref:FAD-binding protein n=1 Tax=Lutispora sp. TaxID=2828727 RepID=UPI000ED85276|nr:FAD-binding protein [Lutispora sp.]MEA4961731.1 FAD-binding protein [Lutispora sp.]HCJ58948.1 succinate dehydrogenase [Clostridiaceae bacterium]